MAHFGPFKNPSYNTTMIFEERISHKSLLFHVTSHTESLKKIWKKIQYEPFNFLPFQSMVMNH